MAALQAAAGGTSAQATRIGPVATALVERYSPDAPDAVKDEGAIRVAAWLRSTPAAAVRRDAAGELAVSYDPARTASAMRGSGATSLLAPWRTIGVGTA